MLCAIGDLVEDVVVWASGPPAHGTDTPAAVHRRRGGSAANVAAFAAASGTPSRFVGCVGADPLGDRLADELMADGVEVLLQRRGRTGTIVVLIEPGGERTMLPDRGSATDLHPIADAWLAGVRVLHLPAYSLVPEPIGTTARAAASAVRAAGGLVSVDVSSVGLIGWTGIDDFRALITAVAPDVIFANEAEHDLLGPVAAPLSVVKHGPDPAELTGERVGGGPIDVPVPGPVEATDTTGAGDAFAAGMLGALLAGADPVAAARAGHELAARTLAAPGATLAPTRLPR